MSGDDSSASGRDETPQVTNSSPQEQFIAFASPIWQQVASSSWHPGHVMLTTSLPFLYSAFAGYQKPLNPVVRNVLLERTSGKVEMQNLKLAEEPIRRAVGSAVAGRALRVASSASVGGFCFTLAAFFYATGCQTLEEVMESTRGWAVQSRQRLDGAFGIDNRIDVHHAEYLRTKNMTEEEELEYISKTYFPDEEWVPVEEETQEVSS